MEAMKVSKGMTSIIEENIAKTNPKHLQLNHYL
jgi:hypothetical protein